MDNLGLSVRVLVRTKDRLVEAREYRSPIDGDTYIEGREGSEFVIRVSNNTHRRVLAIPSVDGLSTLDGTEASVKSRGFILEPFTKVDIAGWIRTNEKAAAFYFAGMKDGRDDSYVSRMGKDTKHKGVVGVVFLAEDRPVRMPHPRHSVMLMASSASPSSGVLRSAHAQSATFADGLDEQTLGTGYGRETEFRTSSKAFARGAEIDRFAIFYDDERGLKRHGIDVTRPAMRKANPFPGDVACPAPPGYEG